MIQVLGNTLFLLAVFFLPWQTVAVFSTATVSGEPSAYGIGAVYVVEALVALAFLLRGRQQASPGVQAATRALYFFLAAVFFSLAVSQVEGVGWFHIIHLVCAAMLYHLLVDDRTDLRRILTVFLVGLIIPAALGWLQVLSGSSSASTLLGTAFKDAMVPGVAVIESAQGRLLRAYGTFPHPNIFGGYLAFGALALAWLSGQTQSSRQWAAALIGFALLGTTLVVTFSRSAWLGICVAALVFVVALFRHTPIPPRRPLLAMAVGLLAVFSTVAVFHTEVFSRFDPSQRLETISIQERTNQYQAFGDVFLTNPLLGVGPNAYTFTLARLHPGSPVWSYQPIHNVFLLILAELGLVGFVLLFYWLSQIDQIQPDRPGIGGRGWALALGVCVLTIGLFDHYLWSLWPGLALGCLALGTAVQWKRMAMPDPK